ncbi:MAG: hypothetical protein Q4A01_05840, partial [Coriobacteriales bacterium]|nr:hypothetical protein [Coriobacteriales bacterium]
AVRVFRTRIILGGTGVLLPTNLEFVESFPNFAFDAPLYTHIDLLPTAELLPYVCAGKRWPKSQL